MFNEPRNTENHVRSWSILFDGAVDLGRNGEECIFNAGFFSGDRALAYLQRQVQLVRVQNGRLWNV